MSYQTAPKLTRQALEQLLSRTRGVRMGLLGDLCLDMYWVADMKLSRLSRETPHYPLPVVEERYAPGGAGNAACNIAALKPASLRVFGVVGTDWRGDLLLQALSKEGIRTDGVIRDPRVVTNTYIKPLRCGISDVVYEDPRLDFENRVPLNDATEEKLVAALEASAKELDVLCISDQMEFGCVTPRIRETLCRLGREGLTVIVDSRDRAGLYKNVICKPNEVEAGRLFDRPVTTLDEAAAGCRALAERTGKTAVITLGSQGNMLWRNGQVFHCPACSVEPPLDFCGAGDTFLAGFGVFLACGAAPEQAAMAANLCSAVTVKKLGTTGTASPEELLNAHRLYF